MTTGRASSRVRVLVVDDSAFARKVVRESLSRSPRIEVVGIARDGLEALEKIAALRPDVVTLDLVMPNLDGLGVLRSLAGSGPGAPRVVLVSMTGAASELALDALALGAVDLIHKPTSQATDQLYELADELVVVVLAAAAARSTTGTRPAPASPARRPLAPHKRLIAIGASTGGPQALTRVLGAMPGDLPVPIAVVLHLPAEYTDALARRLDAQCAIDVTEARDGLLLRPGLAVIARGGIHLKIEPHGSELAVRLDAARAESIHCPSLDVLFESAARAAGDAVIGVVLTGMGSDGLAGARAMHAAGAAVLTEAESTCVVYGMPRAVREAGLSQAEAPLDEMAALILSRL